MSQKNEDWLSNSKPLPDLVVPNLDLLIVGINPGRHAALAGHHFAGPVNHFWKCLYKSGLTRKIHTCFDDEFFPSWYKIGITNLVLKPTNDASEISKEDWKTGAEQFLWRCMRNPPKVIAFNGISSFRAFARHALGKSLSSKIPISQFRNIHTQISFFALSREYFFIFLARIINGLFQDQTLSNFSKLIIGVQNISIPNLPMTKLFVLPSTSPLARIPIEQKIGYFKSLKKYIKSLSPPTEVDVFDDFDPMFRNQNQVYKSWFSFYNSFSVNGTEFQSQNIKVQAWDWGW